MMFTSDKKKKIFYLILFFFSFIFTLFTQLRFYGSKLDFYWNFNFGLQISKGLLPYNDFNIVVTPLLAFLTAGVLKVFGQNIIVYSIFMSFLKLILAYFVAFLTLTVSQLKDENKKMWLFTISFTITNMLLYRYYYEYNYLTCFILLLIIYLEIKCIKNNSNLNNFLIGLLAMLSILSKQSTGIFILIFVLIKPFMFKKDKKKIIYRLSGFLLLLVTFLIYLITTKSFYNFINYTILGLSEFGNNKITVLDTVKVFFKNGYIFVAICFLSLLLFSVLFLLINIYNFLKKKKKYNEAYKNVLFYSIPAFACFYPIMDGTHLIPSILPLFILVYSSFYKKITSKFSQNNYKYVTRYIKFVLIIILIETSLYPLTMYINVAAKNTDMIILNDKYKYLQGMVVDKYITRLIDIVIDYEKENQKQNIKTIILDKDAVIFHMPQDIYYKDYDLFMKGNFGAKGEERLIKEIKNSKNTVYLISKANVILKNGSKYITTDQVPDNIINYVIKNLNKKEEIGIYEVYEPK